MRRTAAALGGFALAVSGVGIGVAADRSRTANVDSDPAPERVVARQLCQTAGGALALPAPSCTDDQFPRRRVEIEDVCNGQPVQRIVSTVQDDIARLRVTEADGVTARPEIFFDLRSGATGRGGDIRLVRFDDTTAGCPQAVALFRYPTRATLGRIPRRAAQRDSFSVSVRELRKRSRGQEIRVSETYVDRDDAFCCPSFRRVSFFSLTRGRNTYVRYATKVKRIKARGKKP